jgi:hypothetical protein
LEPSLSMTLRQAEKQESQDCVKNVVCWRHD